MARATSPVPAEFHTATPYLMVKNGTRSGGLTDPFGHVWYVATRQEDLAPEEIAARAAGG